MFLFKGGQTVEKGTYWEPNAGKKVVLEKKGFLPAGKIWYYKLPESYLLIPLSLYGLILSMAFPYGVGLVLFGIMFILYRLLFSLTTICEKFLGNAVSYLFIRYKPNVSFFSGRPKKQAGRNAKDKK